MRFLSRTVHQDGNCFEMYYQIHGDKLILKDVIPETKGTNLDAEQEAKYHTETAELISTYDNQEDESYLAHLESVYGILITDDMDEEDED